MTEIEAELWVALEVCRESRGEVMRVLEQERRDNEDTPSKREWLERRLWEI
jgi:hypothetical protein